MNIERSARESSDVNQDGQRFDYTTGTVSITRGSTVLRGRGTDWHTLAGGGLPAAPVSGKIVIDGGEEVYDVHLVNSDTLITLKRPFARDDVQGAHYTFFQEIAGGLRAHGATMMVEQAGASLRPMAAGGTARAGGAAPIQTPKSAAGSPIGEAIRTIVYALLIALVIRAVLIQPFNIPSGSMIPTLLVGDYLFVSKYPYGISRHSLPFSPPIFAGRIFGHAPERGDVVVFKLPSDNKTDYIKRLIGLPGDRVQMIDGALYINGEPVKRERVQDQVLTDGYGNVRRTPQYKETLPNGASYVTLDSDPRGTYDNTDVYVVPAGHYFMMGDNRDNSADSRAAPNYQSPRDGGVGYVPLENFVGRAELIFFSTDGSARFWEFWAWPSATRWSRLFDRVD